MALTLAEATSNIQDFKPADIASVVTKHADRLAKINADNARRASSNNNLKLADLDRIKAEDSDATTSYYRIAANEIQQDIEDIRQQVVANSMTDPANTTSYFNYGIGKGNSLNQSIGSIGNADETFNDLHGPDGLVQDSQGILMPDKFYFNALNTNDAQSVLGALYLDYRGDKTEEEYSLEQFMKDVEAGLIPEYITTTKSGQPVFDVSKKTARMNRNTMGFASATALTTNPSQNLYSEEFNTSEASGTKLLTEYAKNNETGIDAPSLLILGKEATLNVGQAQNELSTLYSTYGAYAGAVSREEFVNAGLTALRKSQVQAENRLVVLQGKTGFANQLKWLNKPSSYSFWSNAQYTYSDGYTTSLQVIDSVIAQAPKAGEGKVADYNVSFDEFLENIEESQINSINSILGSAGTQELKNVIRSGQFNDATALKRGDGNKWAAIPLKQTRLGSPTREGENMMLGNLYFPVFTNVETQGDTENKVIPAYDRETLANSSEVKTLKSQSETIGKYWKDATVNMSDLTAYTNEAYLGYARKDENGEWQMLDKNYYDDWQKRFNNAGSQPEATTIRTELSNFMPVVIREVDIANTAKNSNTGKLNNAFNSPRIFAYAIDALTPEDINYFSEMYSNLQDYTDQEIDREFINTQKNQANQVGPTNNPINDLIIPFDNE